MNRSFVIFLIVLCASVFAAPMVSADRRGETVCGIPPEEVIAITWQGESFGGGTWYACGPIQCTSLSNRTQEEALNLVYNERRETPRFVCNFSADVPGDGDRGVISVRLYRLNHNLSGGDYDSRRYLN